MTSVSLRHYSVQSSHSLVSGVLRPHGLQHARPPCPSPTHGVYTNSCPLSRWCHPTISSSVVPFSSCLQSVPASGSFPMSQLFASSTGVSASTPVLPKNTQDWFPLGWTGWISLQLKSRKHDTKCWKYVEQQNSHSVLVKKQNGTATQEDSRVASYRDTFGIWSSNCAPWYLSKVVKNSCPHKIYTWMIIVALFTVPQTWK